MQEYMDRLVNDGALSVQQKTDVLKTLSTVLRNLADPTKGGLANDLKYRTLNMSNEKLQSRLFCVDYIMALLVDLVGFTKDKTTNELVMANPPSSFLQTRLNQEWLPVLNSTQTTLVGGANKKAKLTKASSTVSNSSTASSSTFGEGSGSGSEERLSEKQKARRLLQQKQEQEKEAARVAREATRAQIAADKRVRLEDPNWKPSVSAAAAKNGTKLQTFRDRHGE